MKRLEQDALPKRFRHHRLVAAAGALLAAAGTAAAAQGGAAVDQSLVVLIAAIAHMISVLALKITAFVIGYKIAKLGYETLIRGVTGELDFGFSSGSTLSARLKSASPGTLFVLLGVALIAWGLFVDKPFKGELLDRIGERSGRLEQQQGTGAAGNALQGLPGMKR